MQQTHILRTLLLSASLAAVSALGVVSASAQTAPSTASTACPPSSAAAAQTATAPTTTTAHAGTLSTAAQAPKGGSTAAMVQEACQRQRARTAKFVNCGIPEAFGSEEPFTFNPYAPCP